MPKEFNLSEKIEMIWAKWITNKIDSIQVKRDIDKDVKQFIKRRDNLDSELWICVMGEVDIQTKLKLNKIFDKHKVEKNKLAGEKLVSQLNSKEKGE